ncbi:MAG: SDR family NAD(P)-dependent oxidoreductase [Alphaproteobacteria bacterium]
MDLTGKTIVITGAASGIGRATADACVAAGANVVASDLAGARLDDAVAALESKRQGAAIGVPADIRDGAQVAAVFDRASARYGRLDGVFANAGITGPRVPAGEIDFETWRNVIDVNLHGTFRTASEGARRLIAQGRGGSIVISGSSQGLRPVPGFVAYAATKGALHTLVHSLALELAPQRIRVNALIPGTTNTELVQALGDGYGERMAKSFPLGELVEPGELAQLVVFAMTDLAPHMTGTHLKIDSGRLIA